MRNGAALHKERPFLHPELREMMVRMVVVEFAPIITTEFPYQFIFRQQVFHFE